jgi:Protein of unknown function (DUF2950)
MSRKRTASCCLLVALSAILMAFTSRRGSLETNAIGSCHVYCSAQTRFKRTDWDKDGVLEYSSDFTLLHSQPGNNGDPIDIVDVAFAATRGLAGKPKDGYLFLEMKTIAGKPIDWTTEYALCAIPAVYGKASRRTFIVSAVGTVWAKDIGGAAGFVTDFPADPIEDGWHIADNPPSEPTPAVVWYVPPVLLMGLVALLLLLRRLGRAKSFRHWLAAAVAIMVIIAGTWSLLWYVVFKVSES